VGARPALKALPTAGLALALWAAGAGAQERPAPPSRPAPGDTAVAVAAPEAAEPAALDTAPPETARTFDAFPAPDRFAVARWDRAGLLLSGALTLGELLAGLPDLHSVRFGFLEGPSALTCCGAGPAAVEYVLDGVRVLPLVGGALDPLALPLALLESVVVRRAAWGLRVELATRRLRGRVPYSTIEGGTGDLDVTLLRGLFVGPFLGGEVDFAFDRVETRGFRDLGAAERLGTWIGYARRLPWDASLSVQWLRAGVRRAGLPAPDRSELIVQIRRAFGDRAAVELYGATASETADSVAALAEPARRARARRAGLRATAGGGGLRVQVGAEAWDGRDVPDWALALEAEGRAVAGLEWGADARREAWGGDGFDAGGARVRWRPVAPLALEAEAAAGRARIAGPDTRSPVDYRRATARATARLGAVVLHGSLGRWRVAPAPLLGLFFDRGAEPLAGGTTAVWSAGAEIPTFLEPVRLTGRYERRGPGQFLYWPIERAEAGAVLHGVYLGGQLEVSGTFHVTLRGTMRSVASAPGTATSVVLLPRRVGSRGELVVRVKDVRVFLGWEGYTDPDRAADVPGAALPQARTLFGLKWEFWN
jgi:hypothetical protein